jgi:hypothetical protein
MRKLPYLQAYKDRHGKPRYYVRDAAKAKRIAIAAPAGTPEFMDQYRAGLATLGLYVRNCWQQDPVPKPSQQQWLDDEPWWRGTV